MSVVRMSHTPGHTPDMCIGADLCSHKDMLCQMDLRRLCSTVLTPQGSRKGQVPINNKSQFFLFGGHLALCPVLLLQMPRFWGHRLTLAGREYKRLPCRRPQQEVTLVSVADLLLPFPMSHMNKSAAHSVPLSLFTSMLLSSVYLHS